MLKSTTSVTGERPEFPPKGTDERYSTRAILAAIALFVLYLLSIWFAFTEAERRSVKLESPPEGADYLLMDVSIARVDLLRAEMTTGISFHVAGQLALDEVTPANNLQLVLNTVHGQQQFDFKKGQRLNPIEAVFPLQGDLNLYPFDRHSGVLWFLVTMPAGKQGRSSPKADNVPKELAESPGLPVGASALEKRVKADSKVNFTASVPGLTFRRSQLVRSAQGLEGLTGIEVRVNRSFNVILISVTSMLMMAALAVGLVAMVLRIVNSGRRIANFHVPMAVSLIFGLPALRNIQPGIPPIGTFGDSAAFIWAEVAAAGSAIALIVHWLLHPASRNTPPP